MDMNKHILANILNKYFLQSIRLPEKLIFVENNTIISDEITLATTMNDYFSTITQKLNITQWPKPIIDDCVNDNTDSVTTAIKRYANHPSIMKIKSHYHTGTRFEFSHILPEKVREKILKLNERKSCSGPIPTNILKNNIDLYCNDITDCINNSIKRLYFPCATETSRCCTSF